MKTEKFCRLGSANGVSPRQLAEAVRTRGAQFRTGSAVTDVHNVPGTVVVETTDRRSA